MSPYPRIISTCHTATARRENGNLTFPLRLRPLDLLPSLCWPNLGKKCRTSTTSVKGNPERSSPPACGTCHQPAQPKMSASHTMPCGSCNGIGRLHNTSPMHDSEKEEIAEVLKAVGPLLPSNRNPTLCFKPSQIRRVLVMQLYCQYRKLHHDKVASRKLASMDMYGHERHHGIVKAEYRSFVLTKSLHKRLSGGNRSKQAELLSSSMDKMREWLRAQKRGTVKPLGFARWVSTTFLEPLFGNCCKVRCEMYVYSCAFSKLTVPIAQAYVFFIPMCFPLWHAFMLISYLWVRCLSW